MCHTLCHITHLSVAVCCRGQVIQPPVDITNSQGSYRCGILWHAAMVQHMLTHCRHKLACIYGTCLLPAAVRAAASAAAVRATAVRTCAGTGRGRALEGVEYILYVSSHVCRHRQGPGIGGSRVYTLCILADISLRDPSANNKYHTGLLIRGIHRLRSAAHNKGYMCCTACTDWIREPAAPVANSVLSCHSHAQLLWACPHHLSTARPPGLLWCMPAASSNSFASRSSLSPYVRRSVSSCRQ
jgi:hypothetical protein